MKKSFPIASFLLFAALSSGCAAATGGGGTVAPKADATNPDVAAADTSSGTDAAVANDVATADIAAVSVLPPGDLSGQLSDGDNLQGDYTLTAPLVIPAGATVNILSGTTITSPSFSISVAGTLLVAGTQAAPVVISGPSSGKAWTGVKVTGTLTASWLEIAYAAINLQSDKNGTLTLDHCHLHHAQQYNLLSRGQSTASRMLIEEPRLATDATYNVGVSGGTLTIEDSTLRNTPNEVITMDSGATLLAHYNLLDAGHCGIHFNPCASAEVLHNEFKGNQYGMMLMGLGQGEFHGNNFSQSAQYEIAEDKNQTATVNLSGNYWGDGQNFVLQGVALDTTGALTAPALDVGPRPEK